MRSGKTLLFALAVLLLCSLFATMMSTHHVAEGFASSSPTLTPEAIARNRQIGLLPALPPDLLAANNITDPVGTPMNPNKAQMEHVKSFYAENPSKPSSSLSLWEQLKFNFFNLSPNAQRIFNESRVATEGFAPGDPLTPAQIQANTIALANQTAQSRTPQIVAIPGATSKGPPPALPYDILAANKITDPVGTPMNPNVDQMSLIKEYYAKNPKAPPTPLSLRDQLMFNYFNLPGDLQNKFKAMANPPMDNSLMMMPGSAQVPTVMMGGPAPMEIRPDAPTSSWSRNGVQIVSNVPQTCAPFVQQTMDADGNYFGARVQAGMPQNAMSFPPPSYSIGPPNTMGSFTNTPIQIQPTAVANPLPFRAPIPTASLTPVR